MKLHYINTEPGFPVCENLDEKNSFSKCDFCILKNLKPP